MNCVSSILELIRYKKNKDKTIFTLENNTSQNLVISAKSFNNIKVLT